MTNAVPAGTADVAAFHQLLLRTAGRLPDEVVTRAREWLAAGALTDVAQAVVFAAPAGQVTITAADADLLATTLAAGGEDTSGLDDIERAEHEREIAYGLAPIGPDVVAAHRDSLPYCLDLTGDYAGPGGIDAVDDAVRAQAADLPSVRGVWRVWRYPVQTSQWPPARRIYLVQDTGALPAATAVIVQAALTRAGERDPQVEVFADTGDLPSYQRNALAFSALIWAAEPPTPVRMARLYDEFTPERGVVIAADHDELATPEAERVLAYLRSALPLLISPTTMADVVRPERGTVVPVAFYTDGRWIWPEASSYYLAEYGLAPDADLLDTIREAGYEAPAVDEVTTHRALTYLYSWNVDETGHDEAATRPVDPTGEAAGSLDAAAVEPIRIARLFDRVDPQTGPAFDPGHPTLTAADNPYLLLEYLNGGAVLLDTTEWMTDVLDPGLGPAVPTTYRTDGTWIWTDASTYYLSMYGLSPDADLIAHIRARDHQISELSAATTRRALAVLTGTTAR